MNESVYLNGQAVGQVQVKRQGLYYHIGCRCRLPDEQVYYLKATCGKQVKELGICVPMGDWFGVDTAVPVKQVGEGMIQFELACKRAPQVEQTIPVNEDAAFDYLQELSNARMRIEKDFVGIVIQSDP